VVLDSARGSGVSYEHPSGSGGECKPGHPTPSIRMLPYQDFFYGFDDLPEGASPADIRRACPDGLRRQHAFRHFCDLHPDDVRYLLGYLAAYAKNGVYDDQQFRHCFAEIDRGLQLNDRSGCHVKLRKLRVDLERQHAEMLEECSSESPADRDAPWFQFRSGNYDPIVLRYQELASSVVPRGILGPPEEKEFWALAQFMIRISLMRGDMQEALTRMDKYEEGRIAVRLTPMPHCDIQEAILGYLATRGIGAALERLQVWLDNSRKPIVSDVVRGHPAFRHLCATCQA